jgi:hypothetical protein
MIFLKNFPLAYDILILSGWIERYNTGQMGKAFLGPCNTEIFIQDEQPAALACSKALDRTPCLHLFILISIVML